MFKRIWSATIIAIGISALLAIWLPKTRAGNPAADAVSVGSGDIGGVVTSSKGPEAGVWVIAETTALPTKYVKIVVTDDAGRYLVPELPKATYKVWVRGYGLVDSAPMSSTTGKELNLTAKLAPDARAAAHYYPAEYWYSLLKFPPKSDFPGTGDSGNGIAKNMATQDEWINWVKTDGCEGCHQVGDKATREFPASLGHFDSSKAEWARRLSSAQVGSAMNGILQKFGRDRALDMYADWTDRIAKGEIPKEAPQRPQGIERNVVITEWDWGTPKEYFHDQLASEKRNPTTNSNGYVYGVHEASHDTVSILDPVHNKAMDIPVTGIDPKTPYAAPQDMSDPSPYYGSELIWDSKATLHSLTMDAKGRIWPATAIRPRENPAYCKAGSNLPSAMAYPLDTSGRQVSMYDPETRKFTPINLCFSTQHVNFAEDANNTLWFSAPNPSDHGGDVVGWLNTKMYEATHDEQKSQGWTTIILDTNGNGKRDDYVEPDQPIDPTKDKRIEAGFYAISASPVDSSVWGSRIATYYGFPGAVIRLNPGSNPPATALGEIYEPPLKDPKNPKAGYQGYAPRGMDIDRNGVIWTVLGSGHLASFDRRKCKGPLNGPLATGQQCPEGWKLYPVPGPTFKDSDIHADSNYYDWVDQFDTFGLGKNVPIATGNGSDSLLALQPDTGKFVVLRVPYPMGFYAKSIDGRIDDPKAGWKGRGLWSGYDMRAPQHIEGGKGTSSKVVKFQLRPDPLAK